MNACYSNPISHFKHLQREVSGQMSVLVESLRLNLAVTFSENDVLSCVIYITRAIY